VGEVSFTSEANLVSGSHAFQQNFHLCGSQKDVLFPKLMVSLNSPEQHSLLLDLMPLNSLITSDYITACPHSQETSDYDQRSMQVNWLGLHVLSTVK